MHINFSKRTYSKSRRPVFPSISYQKHSSPLSPPKYGIVELYYLRGVYMSQDKQMKAVSPLLQQVINISSIVGGVGSLIFCIWAYQAGILQSKETLSAFIQQAGIWGPPLFIFYRFYRLSFLSFLEP